MSKRAFVVSVPRVWAKSMCNGRMSPTIEVFCFGDCTQVNGPGGTVFSGGVAGCQTAVFRFRLGGCHSRTHFVLLRFRERAALVDDFSAIRQSVA